MNSKLNQKILALGLTLSLCILAACASPVDEGEPKTSCEGARCSPPVTDGDEGSQEFPLDPLKPKICYQGANKDNKACVNLKSIAATTEGYKNPYTSSSFPSGFSKDQYRMPIQGVILASSSPNLKIAKNFKLSEFMSIQKGDYGIFSTIALSLMQKIRDQVQGSLKVHSGFRSPKWNSGIDGSAEWSRHQYGDGIDFSSSTATLDQLIQICVSLGADFKRKYVSHVHCDWRNEPLDSSFYGTVGGRVNIMSHQEVELNTIRTLKETSQIVVSGTLRAGNIILLKSTEAYQEDPENPYKRWIIKKPNGDVLDVEEQEVSLYLVKGVYHVVHDIGGNIELRKTLVVK